jgi:outer membrane receptor protein involved in Fe transport
VNAIYKSNDPNSGYEFGIGGWYTYADNNYKMEIPTRPGEVVERDHDKFVKKVIGAGFTSKKWYFDEVVLEPAVVITDKEIQGIEYNIQAANKSIQAYALANKNTKENFLVDGLDLDWSNSIGYSIYEFEDKAMTRYDFSGRKREPLTKWGGEMGVDANDSYDQKYTFINKVNLNYLLDQNNTFNLNSVYNYANSEPEDELRDLSLGHKTNFETTLNSWVLGLTYDFSSNDQKFVNSLSAKYYFYATNTWNVSINDASVKEKLDFNKSNFGINNAIRYKFTNDFLVKASAAYDVRLPSENELLGDGYLILPSGELTPERNLNFNLGFMYEKSFSDNRKLQLEVNGFFMRLEDMVSLFGDALQQKYQNFGEMEGMGIEAELKLDITNYLYAYSNLTLQNLLDQREKIDGTTKNHNKGERMPNIPYLYSNIGVEIHRENLFGGKNQNSRLYTDFTFIEEYTYNFNIGSNGLKIPRVTSFDLGAVHSFNKGNLSIAFEINNLTDTKVITAFNRPQPGRNYGFKFRYIIKNQ